jgi:hypothetical protein
MHVADDSGAASEKLVGLSQLVLVVSVAFWIGLGMHTMLLCRDT